MVVDDDPGGGVIVIVVLSPSFSLIHPSTYDMHLFFSFAPSQPVHDQGTPAAPLQGPAVSVRDR